MPTDRSNPTAARAWCAADVDGAASLAASAFDFATSPLDPVHHAPLFDPDQIQALIDSDDEARARLGSVSEIATASPGIAAPPSTSAGDRHVPTLTQLSDGISRAMEVSRMTSIALTTHRNGSSRSTAEAGGTTTPASSIHRRAADAAGNKSIDGTALHDDAGNRVAADSARAASGASAPERDARLTVLNPEADMTGTKLWYQSKTVWAAILTLCANVCAFFGYVLSEADQSSLVELVTSIAGGVGATLAIIFRVVATKKTTLVGEPSPFYDPQREFDSGPHFGDGEPTRSVPDAADLTESDFRRMASNLEDRITKSGIRNTTSSGSTDRSPSAAGRNGALLVAAVLIVSASGAGCADLDALYVDADRATYDAIAPEYLDYVNADAALDADAKASRRDTVGLWESRIRTATESPP